MDYSYPREAMGRAWELVCLNQFHDIIPGSSIGAVYEESQRQYAEVAALGEAARDADVLVTDVWSSMGHEAEHRARLKAFGGYSLNSSLVAIAKPKAMIQHCLPAHRGEEISEDLLNDPRSAAWDQAENRLHVQKALLEFLVEPAYHHA